MTADGTNRRLVALGRRSADSAGHTDLGSHVERGYVAFSADPVAALKKQPGEINRHYGGRGLYFMDPSGHAMEIMTRPYGNEE